MRKALDLTRQDQSVSFRMRELTKWFGRLIVFDLRPFSITIGQWRFLRMLWERDGVSQQELSDGLGMTSAATVASVNLLERDDLAVRVRHPSDNRRYLIYLTAKGKKLRRQTAPVARTIQIEAFSDFSERESEEFFRLLERMQTNLETAWACRQGTERGDPETTRKPPSGEHSSRGA